jgi:hypothetical protein
MADAQLLLAAARVYLVLSALLFPSEFLHMVR